MKTASLLLLIFCISTTSNARPPLTRDDLNATPMTTSGCQLTVLHGTTREHDQCPASLSEVARFPTCANFRKDASVWIDSPAGGITLGRTRTLSVSKDATTELGFGIIGVGNRSFVDAQCSSIDARGKETLALSATENDLDILCCPGAAQ